MKKLTKFLFAALAMTVAFSSCNNGGDDSGTTKGEALRLVPSKTTLVANGIDKITFQVFQGEMDVTAISQICGYGGGVCLLAPEFTTTTPGTHQYYAYFTNDMSVKSEPVTLTATESVFDATRVLFKKVTFMTFTAAWCGPCYIFKGYMKDIEANNSETLLNLNFYTTNDYGGQANPEPKVMSPITDNFANQLGSEGRFRVSGFPTAFADLDSSVGPAGYVPSAANANAAYNKYIAVPATTAISVISELGETINLTVSVGANTVAKYRIGVLLIEDHISGFQNGGGNTYDHINVLRDKATENIFGDELGTFEAGQVITKEYSLPIDAKYNTDNLSIVVYTLREKSAGVWIIDNSVKAPLGEVVDFKYAE